MNKSGIVSSIEEQKHNKDRRSVFVDGQYAFSLDIETLVKSKLTVGSAVTQELADSLINQSQYMSCKEYGFRLLSSGMYPTAVVIKKMTDKGFDADIAVAVCAKLTELGYIDDLTYAKAFISDASKVKGKGERLIKNELYQKGVSREIIEKCLEGFENSEGLSKLIDKKMKGKQPDRKVVQSVFAACMRKGYNPEDIKDALKKYTDEGFTDE